LFHDLSLTASQELVAITGDNGTGKSMMLKILSGQHEPDSGSIFIGNSRVDGTPPHNRGVFLMQQQPTDNIAPELTVAELFGSLCDVKRRPFRRPTRRRLGDLVAKSLATWPVLAGVMSWADQPTSSLSGGECQRLAVAVAVCSGRPVLLADEPTASLDRANRRLITNLLHDVAARRTVLVATHDDAIKALANRVIVLGPPNGDTIKHEQTAE